MDQFFSAVLCSRCVIRCGQGAEGLDGQERRSCRCVVPKDAVSVCICAPVACSLLCVIPRSVRRFPKYQVECVLALWFARALCTAVSEIKTIDESAGASESKSTDSEAAGAEFDTALAELRRWVDTTTAQYVVVSPLSTVPIDFLNRCLFPGPHCLPCSCG